MEVCDADKVTLDLLCGCQVLGLMTCAGICDACIEVILARGLSHPWTAAAESQLTTRQ